MPPTLRSGVAEGASGSQGNEEKDQPNPSSDSPSSSPLPLPRVEPSPPSSVDHQSHPHVDQQSPRLDMAGTLPMDRGIDMLLPLPGALFTLSACPNTVVILVETAKSLNISLSENSTCPRCKYLITLHNYAKNISNENERNNLFSSTSFIKPPNVCDFRIIQSLASNTNIKNTFDPSKQDQIPSVFLKNYELIIRGLVPSHSWELYTIQLLQQVLVAGDKTGDNEWIQKHIISVEGITWEQAKDLFIRRFPRIHEISTLYKLYKMYYQNDRAMRTYIEEFKKLVLSCEFQLSDNRIAMEFVEKMNLASQARTKFKWEQTYGNIHYTFPNIELCAIDADNMLFPGLNLRDNSRDHQSSEVKRQRSNSLNRGFPSTSTTSSTRNIPNPGKCVNHQFLSDLTFQHTTAECKYPINNKKGGVKRELNHHHNNNSSSSVIAPFLGSSGNVSEQLNKKPKFTFNPNDPNMSCIGCGNKPALHYIKDCPKKSTFNSTFNSKEKKS
jgi:hypothetical protein